MFNVLRRNAVRFVPGRWHRHYNAMGACPGHVDIYGLGGAMCARPQHSRTTAPARSPAAVAAPRRLRTLSPALALWRLGVLPIWRGEQGVSP